MSKITCFNNTRLEEAFNKNKTAEKFEENAAAKTIKAEYDSILAELNSIREELGLPLESSKIAVSELKFTTESNDIRYQILGEKGASRIEEYNNLLNQAKTLEKQGKDYSQTGWFKNEQGQWKYFSNEILNEFLDFPQIKNKTVNLKDLLKKDSILLKAYPELENTKIEFYEDTKDSDFRGDERVNGTVTEEGETTILHIRTDGKGQSNQSQVLLHELNHKLQRVEQFARGGSPNFLLKIAGFITKSQGLSGKEIVENIKSFNTDSLNKDDKKVIEIAREYFNKFPNSEQLLEDGYFLLQGEVDSRAVELAFELKNKFGKDVNFTYSELIKELGKKEGIDLTNEAISIFIDDVVLSKSINQYKNTISEKLSIFDNQIKDKKYPTILEVAEEILPPNIFNKYKDLYEMGARNNIQVDITTVEEGFTASWGQGSINLSKSTAEKALNSFEDFAETLNHETIHGILSRGIRDNYSLNKDLESVMSKVEANFDSASQDVRNIISYIQDTRREFKETDILNATDQELENDSFREVGSLEELITYAFTNKVFADFLDSIPATEEIKAEGDSIFTQLKNIIRNFINGLTENTALDEISNILEKYLDTSYNEKNIKERNDRYEWGMRFEARGQKLNLNKNGNKQLSQTEEQGRTKAGRIAIEATNILRGSGSTISENKTREEQIDELRVWSTDNGYYIEDYTTLGKYQDKGMESQVYYNEDSNSVFKVNDLEFYDTPLDYLDAMAVHNQLFPEAPLVVKGFTTRQDTFNFAVIVEQPFVEAERGATQEEVKEELSKMGYSYVEDNTYTNGRYTIEDLHEGNILINKQGSLIFINPVIRINDVQKQQTIEPSATFNGFNSYSEAVKNTPINDTIKIDITGVNVAEVTNNGDINDLIRQDIILDERELTPSGEIVYITAGNSITKKLVNAEIAKEVIKGNINEDGNIVAKEKVELTKVSDDFNKNKKEFGESTALSILASQILLNNTPTLGNNRIIDYSIEIPSDNVLMIKLKNLLQELGIKTMSLEDWAKNYKTRTGQDPTANSLADISNRIIAFANGQVNQDTLSEEVMHFIVEALPQEQIQPLLDMIHKTDEWKQYAAQYTEIYKDDNTVRREILGKVLKNYIQSQQEQSTLQGQSVVRRLLEIVDKFIAQIRGLFKPQHQVQLDKFTEEIYQRLMKEELYSELSPSQFDGNTLVMYQAEPSTIYDYLTKTLEAFDSLDKKTGGQNKFELSLLDVENRDELNQLKATAALSAIIKTKIKYLTKRGRQSGFLSVEEQQVYDVALNELAPTLGKLKNIISEKPFSNAFLKQQVLENVTQTITELSELSTALNEDNQKVFDTLVEDVAEQTGLTPEMTEILKNEIKTLQRDTNQFYSLYGSLSQAQSPILNILSTVISDAERESIIQYDRRQSEFINATKALGFKEEEIADQLKKFKDGYYFISEYDFEAIEKEKAVFRAEAYSEVTGTSITAEEFLKEEQKLLKKLPQKQRNTYNFKFKEKVDKSGMHHDRLTKEERTKADSLIEGFSEKTKRFLADQAKRKGAIAQRIKDNNGASKEDNNLLKELSQQRQKMANPYDEYGILHKGLQINMDGEVSKSPTFDDSNTKDSDREIATTILELAEYNKKIVAQYKAREAIEGKQVVPQSFIDKVKEIRGNGDVEGVAKATEFLLMNTRISYNSNFWEMFEKTNGLIEKLRESSDSGAQSTADDIQKNRTRLKNILKEHRDYNNPSQIDFENLGGAESTIKEISSDLEHLYEKAKSYLRDNETLKKTTESESITNKAYRDVIQDRGIDLIANRKDYEARLDFVLKHVTPNSRARILRNADSFISYKKGYSKKLPKSIEKFENRSKGIVGFNEEVAIYEDILDYAESLLLPYFKELKPTNFDMQEFVTNLVKAETEAEFNKVIEEAEYVTITPSYSLVDSEDNKRLNPKYTEAYEANDPTINLDYKGGILRSKNYIEMFAPDANGNATKNVKQKQLLDLTVGFWADSIESANMTDSFNKYQLPGIRRGSLARKEQVIKNFSVKSLKESIKDVITVREDDPIFGQAADTASRGALTIPRIGFSKLETAEEVTDELLYSLMHTANQAEKRKQRINSLDKIEAVKTRLRGASYGDKSGEATTAYEMADDFIRYNIYGQTETFKWETDFFGLTSKKYNLAPVIKHFQGWTRLVGIGFSTLVPLTSFLQGSTNFVVENIVGDRINTTASRLAAKKAGQLVSRATKEEFMSDLKTKSELNLLMQFFGLSNPVSNFQNSNYGRTVRGLAPENSAYFSHFMGDLPLTAQTIMTVLYDFKVVEIKDDNGVVINTKLQSYSEWRNDNKALRIAGNTVPATEKEAIAEWKLNDKYLYNYIETKKDGNNEIVGMQMNSEYYKLFTGKEKYANDRLNFVKRKITTVKQEIDNQIPNEDKSYIQRHAIFSFISMFKGFLITSVNKRFKDRHRSNQTNMLEEGTYKGTSAFLGALINSGRKGSFKDFWKEQYREFDGGYKLEKEGTEYAIYDTSKDGDPEVFRTTDKAKAESAHAQLTVQATQMRQVSLKRAGLDLAVTASLATIALLLKGLADDDDDDYVKEFVAYMSYRVAVETTSQSTGIAGQLYSFIQSPTAGLSAVNNLINIGDLGSSEITKSGTYRGYSERDALLYRSLPLMKEYFRLKEIDRSRQDYKKYNKHFIDNFNMVSLIFDEESRK